MVDLTRTRRDLVEQALMNLGALASGQSAQTEDVERVDGFVDATLALLAATDIIYIPYSEEIPVEAFLPLAAYLANASKASFGRAGDAALQTEAEQAKYDLKCIARPFGSQPLLRTESVLRGGVERRGTYTGAT